MPPGAYPRNDNFKRFVIDPALLEVNKLSDMGVAIELVRRHSRAPAHAVSISWWKLQGDDYRAAMEERNRSKVGRMARLKGAQEIVLTTALAIADAEIGMRLEQMRAGERAVSALKSNNKVTVNSDM